MLWSVKNYVLNLFKFLDLWFLVCIYISIYTACIICPNTEPFSSLLFFVTSYLLFFHSVSEMLRCWNYINYNPWQLLILLPVYCVLCSVQLPLQQSVTSQVCGWDFPGIPFQYLFAASNIYPQMLWMNITIWCRNSHNHFSVIENKGGTFRRLLF